MFLKLITIYEAIHDCHCDIHCTESERIHIHMRRDHGNKTSWKLSCKYICKDLLNINKTELLCY